MRDDLVVSHLSDTLQPMYFSGAAVPAAPAPAVRQKPVDAYRPLRYTGKHAVGPVRGWSGTVRAHDAHAQPAGGLATQCAGGQRRPQIRIKYRYPMQTRFTDAASAAFTTSAASMISGQTETLSFDDPALANALFGPCNAALTFLAERTGADLATRGSTLSVSTPDPLLRERLIRLFAEAYGLVRSGREIGPSDLEQILDMPRSPCPKSASPRAMRRRGSILPLCAGTNLFLPSARPVRARPILPWPWPCTCWTRGACAASC